MSDLFDVTEMYNYRGIAGNVLGWAQEPITVSWEDDEGNVYFEHDFVDSDQFVEFVWVGDDTVHIVDIEDLGDPIREDCVCSCGTVRCWALGTDME